MPKSKVITSILFFYGFILVFSFILKGFLNPFVPLILQGWILVVIYLFKRYPPAKALIISFVFAVLFLPEFELQIRNDIAITKTTATVLGASLATFFFYPNHLLSVRLSSLDIPTFIWMVVSIPSQILNGLSPVTPTIQHVLVWGMPYLLARIYLKHLSDLQYLATAIFFGGLLYAPLCLLENIKTPNLHLWLYGFAARGGASYLQTFRFGGYRPTVFMNHGLAVGMWMMAATLMAIWLWQTKAIPKRLWNFRTNLIVLGLVFVLTQVRSTGAYMYSAIGILTFILTKWWRTALPLLLIASISISYVYLGATGQLYEIPQVREYMYKNADGESEGDSGLGEREDSFRFRMRNEELLSKHARKQFVFGWGGSGRNRVYDEEGQDTTVTDSLWIIEFGVRGILGLAGFFLTLILPVIGFILRYPAWTWRVPKVAAAVGLATILVLYSWDSALNAFPNPVYILASGGLVTVAIKPREKLDDRRSRSPTPV